MVKFALQRPVTTSLGFLALLLLGLAATRLLPMEQFPGIDIPQVMVQVPYQNATPAEVERLIIRPLEESLATIGGIHEMVSTARPDRGTVRLDFAWDDDIRGRNIAVREQVDAVRHLLPDDVEQVFIYQFNTDDQPILQLRLSSEQDLARDWQLLKRQLKTPLERIAGVSRVDLQGVDMPDIVIRLKPAQVAAAGLTPEALEHRLQRANFSVSAGFIEDNQTRIQVNPQGEFRSLQDIRELPVNRFYQLQDLAAIHYETPEPQAGRRFAQAPAIGLDIFKESSANLVDVADEVTATLTDIQAQPDFADIQIMSLNNLADNVTRSLKDLLQAGLLGAVLSVVVLFLFLCDWRSTLVIVLSVPLSLALTLAAMYLLGYSLNVLSMMGLMLAIGMLIDNSVVVTESIAQQQVTRSGSKRYSQAAIITGTKSVRLAILAGTVTTAIVFLPNILGAKVELTVLLEHAAIAICLSLLASLLVAQTLVPLLLSQFPANNGKASARAPVESTWQKFYRRSLAKLLQHPRWTTALFLLLVGSTAIPISQLSTDAPPQAFNDQLYLNYQIKGQYKLEQVEQEVARLESFLYAHQEQLGITDVYSYYTPGHASSTLLLDPAGPMSVVEIQQWVRHNLPPLPLSEPIFGFQGGPGDGVQLTLSGRSTTVLQDLAEQVTPLLERIPGLVDVQTETDNLLPELQIKFNRERLAQYELSTAELTQRIALALRGQPQASFRHHPGGDIRIRLTYPEHWRQHKDQLTDLVVANVAGRELTLGHLADLQPSMQPGSIRRYDRQTALRVQGNLNDLSMGEARAAITEQLAQLELPPGYQWSFGGGFRTQQEQNQVMLINMLLAVMLVYMVMAALFESLLLPNAVIGSLALALMGACWTLWLTGTHLELMALIGMLILLGVVVNNGIVLVDQINQHRPHHEDLRDAVVAASVTRLRPILMTVLTTMLGMLPLALGDSQVGGSGPSYAPMAITIMGGLGASALTSLYFVPHAYCRLLAWRQHWHRLYQLGWQGRSPQAY